MGIDLVLSTRLLSCQIAYTDSLRLNIKHERIRGDLYFT